MSYRKEKCEHRPITRCRPGLDGQIMGGLSFGLSSAEEEKLKDVEGGRY